MGEERQELKTGSLKESSTRAKESREGSNGKNQVKNTKTSIMENSMKMRNSKEKESLPTSMELIKEASIEGRSTDTAAFILKMGPGTKGTM